MIAVLRQRNFALLWFGGLISFMGDWVMFTALPLYVLAITSSVAAMGLYFVFAAVPGMVLGSIGGIFVDRWDRKWILVVTNILLAPVYSLLFFVHNSETVWITYIVALAANTIRQLLNPAENALLPKLVGESDLVTANSLNSLNNNLARLIGPAVGGLVFAWFGFQTSVLLDVLSFLFAASLIALIAAPRSVTRAEKHEGEAGAPAPPPNMFREWVEGLNVIRHNRTLSVLLGLATMVWLADGAITVLFPVYVTEALHGGSIELGWLMTAQAIGGLIGSALIGRVSKKMQAWQLVAWGILFFGVFDLLTFGIPVLLLNLVFLVLIGAPLVGLDVGALTILQTNTPDRFRGRVFGTIGTTTALMLFIGRIFATFLGGNVPVVPMLVGVCAVLTIVGLLSFRLLHDPNQVKLSEMREEKRALEPQPITE
ncbi:MAG: MFS transporter [Chloroflexia bacterium]